MKRFLLKILLFSVCVVVMDMAFGYGFSWLRGHAKGGDTAKIEYMANRICEDIVILGSSRAANHYIPQMIEESVGMSCYNCGKQGNGVVLAYGRLKMLTDCYRPNLIIYEVTPKYDYGTEYPNNKYLGLLRAYYDKEGIREIFNDLDVDSLSRLKMLSKMYQNTGRLMPNVIDNIVYNADEYLCNDNEKGYVPLHGKMDVAKYKPKPELKDGKIDSLKLSYLEKVIELARTKEIPILFMISPMYGGQSNMDAYKPAIDLCKRHNVQVYNYINCPEISNNEAFFNDARHMNHDGAVAYMNIFIKEVLIDEDLWRYKGD